MDNMDQWREVLGIAVCSCHVSYMWVCERMHAQGSSYGENVNNKLHVNNTNQSLQSRTLMKNTLNINCLV